MCTSVQLTYPDWLPTIASVFHETIILQYDTKAREKQHTSVKLQLTIFFVENPILEIDDF